MDQRIIDDISDLLQRRDSQNKEYPVGHPKYRPPADAVLPYIPGLESRIWITFDSVAEASQFFQIFQSLSRDAKERTIEHFK
jgi:hypothetical protein